MTARDTVYTTFTKQEVAAAIREFNRLLESNVSEAEIHRFLATHMYLWHGLLRANSRCPLYQKVRLGSEYEVDFAYFDTGSLGAEWFLVEIERPGARLFNSRGDPSADLTHALAQVRAWQRWIERNRSAAQEIMPEIDRPMGRVFIGRRQELKSSPKAREWLQALNFENRGHVTVRTLDRFATAARGAALGGSSISFPPVALSDRELRAGLPSTALDFVQSDFGRKRDFVEERLLHDYGYFDEHLDEDEDRDEGGPRWLGLGRWFGLGRSRS